MKVILRGLLAGLFLNLSLLLVLSRFTIGLVVQLAPTAAWGRLALYLLVALTGFLADLLIFALVPAAISRTRKLLHALAMAGVFVLGLALLGSLDWSQPWISTARLDLGGGQPFIALLVVGFVGYLLSTLLFSPRPGLPSVLRRQLSETEQALCSIRQTRWLHPIAPDTLLATDRRLLVYRPTNLGFTSSVEDYNYIDIANVKIDRGLLFCTVSIKERFQGHDLEFRHMPKGVAGRFVRTLTDQMMRRRSDVPLAPVGAAAGVGGDGDALGILQQRLARGEISPGEYERLRKEITGK